MNNNCHVNDIPMFYATLAGHAMQVSNEVSSRGLHTSTFQLNLSRF